MPPSGYNKHQSNSIVEFLQSVTQSLIEEGKRFNLSPTEALAREVNNINEIVESKQFDEISNSVLLLTKNYYQQLAASTLNDYEQLSANALNVLENVDKQILAVHVPTIAY